MPTLCLIDIVQTTSYVFGQIFFDNILQKFVGIVQISDPEQL